jgi:CspA family cold shock protein
MYKGKVKWFDEEKEFGVITREDGCNYYVHASSIKSDNVQSLSRGDVVFFDIGRGKKGLEAIYVLVPEKKMTINQIHIVEDRANDAYENSLLYCALLHNV